jgi:hypothetical protein
MKTLYNIDKHMRMCSVITENRKLKEEKFMPIQTITIKGEKMYRFGDSGKLYANRADAEAQARAIYSSGYREPASKTNGGPKNKVMNAMK